MNSEETLLREIEAMKNLKRIDTVTNHHIGLLVVFNNDDIELANFLLFLLINRLLRKSDRLLVVVLCVRLMETNNLSRYLKLLWQVEKDTEKSVLLLYDLVMHTSYSEVG